MKYLLAGKRACDIIDFMRRRLKWFFYKITAREPQAVLPNFVVVGFGKCGTTSLHYALMRHPEIFLAEGKETHFFNVDSEYEKGIKYYWDKHFPHYAGEPAIGDITPAYVYYQKSLPRIRKALGNNVKIIVIMRHPVVRAFSHYIHDVRLLAEKRKFLDEGGDIVNPEYKDVSMYSKSLRNLYKQFPKENILPLIFERDVLASGTDVACRKIEEFIGVTHWDAGKMKAESAKGFLASITVLDRPAYSVDDQGMRKDFKAGDVIFEHKRDPMSGVEGYYCECKTDVPPEELEWYRQYPNNITTTLSPELISDVYNRLYKADALEVAKLTGEDVSIWDAVKNAGVYEVVQSRLVYQ